MGSEDEEEQAAATLATTRRRGSAFLSTPRGYRQSSTTGRRYRTDVDFPWYKAVLVGAVAGFMSGLLGIGGGVIVVPGLVLLVGLNQYSAAATSVATIVGSSAAALYAFSGDGNVDWRTAAVVFAGAAVGAWIGARWMDRVPEHMLAGAFALVMATAAVRMWF
jgi:uncharacterized membrane protein YfcA